MNNLTASMEFGFLVTILKSEVHMTSNLVSLVYYQFKLFSGCGGRILAFNEGKSAAFDFQDTGDSPHDSLS